MEAVRTLSWDRSRCDFCGTCVGVCPADAITIDVSDWTVDEERCTGCGNCVAVCPYRALGFEEKDGTN